MTDRLAILCCRNFVAEVGAGVTAEGWPDVDVIDFPARCGRPPLGWDEIRALLSPDCDQVLVLGRACLDSLGETPPGFPPLRRVPVRQCFHLIAGETLVDEAIGAGSYLVTPTWLADWRGQLQTLGFAPGQAHDLFQEFAREVLLLDTGTLADAGRHLVELQEEIKLPVRRLAIGLDGVRARLARLVLEWRLDLAGRRCMESHRRHARELADHVAAMDLLVQLARTQDEDAAIAQIEHLFHMLFAPGEYRYLRVENDGVIPVQPASGSASLRAQLESLDREHAWTADGNGFLLRIAHGGNVLGLVAVDRLAFSGYREGYLNMALAINGVCGLAIENARNRRRLLEAEKMAALAIVVAGVAHEINTPLGIGLTAASSLQDRTRDLTARFAARTMTQSDLTGYLQHAAEATQLMRSNLDRIAHLTEAFRHVVVNERPLPSEPFAVRDSLETVRQSFAERLAAAHVQVTIECDPALLIDGVANDWSSIVANLIGNSLQHGFKGRSHGRIRIQVDGDAKRWQLRYRDDGVGMSPETLARIFDPFFTTDLQNGMGLGMYLVYNLVTHRLHGTIHCETAPDAGVNFLIDIPR